MNAKAVFFAALWATGLFGAALLAPLIGQVAAVFAPVPLMAASLAYGRREGASAAALSLLAIILMGGWQAGAVFLVGVVLVSLATAEGMRRGLAPERAVGLGSLPPLLVTAVVAVAAVRGGADPVAGLRAFLGDAIQTAAAMYTAVGLAEQARVLEGLSEALILTVVRLAPSLIVVSVLVPVACCYGVTRIVLARRAGPSAAPPGVPLAVWHAPDVWVWGLIAALGLSALPEGILRTIGWNLAVVSSVVYAVQGTAILEFWFRNVSLPAVARGLLIVLILSLPLVVFVIALGVVDVWADLRRVRERPVKTPS